MLQLKFSNNSFIPAAAEVAARAIVNNAATLTHAVMSDIIAGRPEKDALQALVILSQALAAARLTALDLSGNALGEKGLRACADLWRRQARSRPALCAVPRCSSRQRDAGAAAALLGSACLPVLGCAGISAGSALRCGACCVSKGFPVQQHAWLQQITQPIWLMTRKLSCAQPALEQLALQNVGLSIDACQALSELLLHPESLKVLHFRNNMTDDAGALALAQARPISAARAWHFL